MGRDYLRICQGSPYKTQNLTLPYPQIYTTCNATEPGSLTMIEEGGLGGMGQVTSRGMTWEQEGQGSNMGVTQTQKARGRRTRFYWILWGFLPLPFPHSQTISILVSNTDTEIEYGFQISNWNFPRETFFLMPLLVACCGSSHR